MSDSFVKHQSERFGWVWKILATVAGSVMFGWGGHAWMTEFQTKFDTKYQTLVGATADRDRIAALEKERESLSLTLAARSADLAQLRKDFDEYRAKNPIRAR